VDPLWLQPDEVRQVAADYYGISSPAPTMLTDGLINQSWLVGGRIVLRVSERAASETGLGYEHAVLARLHNSVPEAVAPLAARDGETVHRVGDRLVSAFPYIAGTLAEHLPDRAWEPAAAGVLARMHRAGLADYGQRPGTQRLDEQPTAWAQIRPVVKDEQGKAPALFDFFDRESDELTEWLHSGVNLGPAGLIHDDYNPRNLIVASGQIAAVIDWDACKIDRIASEVAGVLAAAADQDRWWRAYQDAGGPLDDEIALIFPALARLNAMRELFYAVDDGRPEPHALQKLDEVAATLRNMWPITSRGFSPGG
jgi:Ser/Thr protein kinase RdoA (MazF antagonist)